MKNRIIYFIIVLLLCFIVAIYVFISADSKDFCGHYFYEECPVFEKTRVYEIDVYKKNLKLYADFEISGYQIHQMMKCNIEKNQNVISVIFDEYDLNFMGESFNKGDVLISFYWDESELITKWEKLTPVDPQTIKKASTFEFYY